MKPLAQLDAREIDALLFDIDETLTTGGKLTALAYAALEKLHAAGKRLVAVTGRPAGWCDQIARMWPVDAVVGENGACEDVPPLPRSVAYVGDSPNDAPMFAFFANSVGVANVGRFASRISDEPKFVTRASSGAGFAALVAHLLR
jgi:hydroxymethylpyrimidine pyrophosphatase-like HAD family hydrolase